LKKAKKLVVKCKTKKKKKKKRNERRRKKLRKGKLVVTWDLQEKEKKMKSCVRDLSKESKEDVFFTQG
jgi:hypothetical protein